MHETKTVTLLASAQRTATATGDAVRTTTGPVKVITGDTAKGPTRHMQVFLDVSAAAAGTLDLTIEGKVNGTWFTLTPASAWTQVTTTPGKQARRYDGPIPSEIRAVGTAASTPDHTYTVSAVLGG